MKKAWGCYWLFHGAVLLAALFFWCYGALTTWLFPDGFYHCFVHDILHLYCPFCGCTRAFLALVRLDVPMALRLNPAAILAGVAAICLDLRALVLLCRGKSENLLPRWVFPAALWLLGGYTWLINTLLFFGVDPVGDLAPYWVDLALWQRVGGALFLAPALLLLLAGLLTRREGKRLPALLLALATLPPLALCLTGLLWWLLAWIPLAVPILCFVRSRKT